MEMNRRKKDISIGALRWTGLVLMSLLMITGCKGKDGGSPPQTGTVSGKVISASTGATVPGATLRAPGATPVISETDGTYTLTANTGARVVIQVEAAGFAETTQIARITSDTPATLDVQLLPIGVAEVLDVGSGGTVAIPNSNAQVDIPANGLLPVSGGTSAASVNVELTAINPAIDPDLMPGDFTAVMSGDSVPVEIESFGALRVDVRDDTGARYTLRAGQSASIRIPVGSLSNTPPATIPLLIFNETTGRWEEEGEATLQGDAPDQFYVGTVQRFGAWNADKPMLTVRVSGCVEDTNGQRVANVRVVTKGINYSGTGSAFTDTDGNFSVPMRRDGLATLSVTFFDGDGKPVVTSINVGPFTADAALTGCIVTEPVPLQIIERPVPLGRVGMAYNARLTASNGTPPYAWSVISGSLPDGLTLDSITGQISGTPTAAGFFSFTVEVTDNSTPAQLDTAVFFISVSAPPPFRISTIALPTGVVGRAYNASLTAVNGTQPYTWSVISGNLPDGLTLNSTTGQISGTPTAAGTFSVTIQAQDSAATPQLASRSFSVIVTLPPPFVITTPFLPAGVEGTAYNTSLSAANGTPPVTWMVTIGFLPPGLTLNSTTGQISGTPTASGTFAFTIEAQDDATPPQSASKDFSITISTVPPPPAPTGVAAFSEDKQIRIVWNAVTDADSYNLYMASVSGVRKDNYSTLADGQRLTGVTSPHIQTGLTNGTTYYFVVTAVSTNDESTESLQVSATPTDVVVPPSEGSTLSAGGLHTCTRLENGTIQCWGANTLGQLGNGTTTDSNTPVQVSGITTATSVSSGTNHTCARLENGTVQCWGANSAGQLGNGINTASNTPAPVSGITTATSISAGSSHSCARLDNGTVQCWGENSAGQLGNGTNTASNTPVPVSGITTATEVSAGGGHSCARLENGTIQCWGNNGWGELGNGTNTASNTPVPVSGITTATSISANKGGFADHSCARLQNGTIQCWGYNGFGQLGNGTNISSNTPVQVSGLTTATSVSAGGSIIWGHSCARLDNGTIQCWGLNNTGQLGNGTNISSNTPVQVSGLTTATEVSTGGLSVFGHSCARLDNGTIQCWGANVWGELGNGTNTSSNTPVQVSGIP